MKQIACRVDDEMYAAIETARGDVPRERWMRSVFARELEAGPTPVPRPADRDSRPGPPPPAPASPVVPSAPLRVHEPGCPSCARHGLPRNGNPCAKCGARRQT